MDKILVNVMGFVGIVALVVFISFLLSWPVMMLWNGCLLGAVTGVNEVSWLQAWGLTVLTGLMFKSSSK